MHYCNSCIFISSFSYSISYHNQSVFDLEKTPESKINIGKWALVIEKEYNPSIDIQFYQKKLQGMAQEINKMLAGRTKDMDKFLAVKTFLYEPGPWNNYKPFSYDLNDPLGNILDRQLISSYIDTRKGNCVSMPTLFLTLMELVDPKVNFCAIKAPLHLFCRLKDRQTGDVWNVETTNGGNPARKQWYIDLQRLVIR
ncbi:MAG: hypothetical protein HF314_03250 [Ignavibacteria bacterium]|nr:hypothetical protein [Ignavibacteria bacterium]MCU7502066.1 hypothetical protein [Ignavibacteria bacterium]MCU7515468.1 hypothetical protein [Ignavibacteria bacterium]